MSQEEENNNSNNNNNNSGGDVDTNAASTYVYTCRKCRRVLFSHAEILPHDTDPNSSGNKGFKQRGLVQYQYQQQYQQQQQEEGGKKEEEKEEELTAAPPGYEACTSYFLDPDVSLWVAEESRAVHLASGGADVSPDTIYCPNQNCGVKIGTQSWIGSQCSCGSWITPAFKIHSRAVDKLPIMQENTLALPRLVSGEAIACVRFLLEWTDAGLQTTTGRVHHSLTNFHLNSEQAGMSEVHEYEEGLSTYTFHMDKLPALVQWLSLGITPRTTITHTNTNINTNTINTMSHTSCMPLIQDALHHVMRDGHAGNARNHHAASARAQTTAEKLLAAARSTQYRGPLVLLLFHPNEAVRMWARETLLRLVSLAAATATTNTTNTNTNTNTKTSTTITITSTNTNKTNTDGNETAARSLWLLSMQLLCTIKHIMHVPLEIHEEGARRVVADGFCSLFAVLSVMDTKLAAVERALLEKAAANGDQHPRLFHGVSTATILLLGGSMLFNWFLSVSTSVGSQSLVSSTRIPTSTSSTMMMMMMIEKLASALNLRLGAETTLQSLALANDTRRALVKIVVHCLLDNAKHVGISSKAEEASCRRRMCELFCMASHIDPPPSSAGKTTTITNTITTSTGIGGIGTRIGGSKSSTPPAKSAGWLLRFLMRNASVQLNIPAAVRGITGGGGGCDYNASTFRTMENAVSALSGIFTSLADALPDLASSLYYHEFLRTQQKDCVALAVSVALGTQNPQAALSLLRHFLLTDLVVFGGISSSNLAECLRSAWEAIPELLVKISSKNVSTSISPSSTLLLQIIELFDVIMDQPSATGWLFLKSIKNGPPPLAWVVGKCIERVTEIVRGSMKEMRHQWETISDNNNNNNSNSNSNSNNNSKSHTSAATAASRLLSSGSTIPRVAHVMMMSSCTVVRRLGETLSALFLHSFTPVVHGTFRSDAANWLLGVILHDPILRENPLKLQNAKVDTLVRVNGSMWVNIMCGCNWSNLSRETLAASWWLCALIADVCVLENETRNQLLDLVITQLHPVFTETTNTNTLSASSSSSSSSLSTPAGIISSTVVSQNDSSAFLAQEPLRQCAQHLMLVILKKCSMYSVSSFTQAVLHIAGALPPLTRSSQDQSFKSSLLKVFVDVLQMLPVEGRHTLMEYPPTWLAEILRSARQKIEDCVADQNRRFQQYEFEEKQMKQIEEGNRKRSEQEAEMCRANMETRKRELIQKQQQQQKQQEEQKEKQGEEKSSLFNTGRKNNGVKREHEDMTPIMIAQTPPVEMVSSSSLLLSLNRPQQRPRLEPSVITSAPISQQPVVQKQPTPQQMHLHQIGEQRVNAFIHAENLNKSTEAIRRVAGSTDILHHSPRTDDIIGHGRYCLAAELPVIPQRFPSLASGGHNHYVASFLPHIALELRYELHQKFDEMVESCRTHTLRSNRNNDHHRTHASLRNRVTGVNNNNNNSNSNNNNGNGNGHNSFSSSLMSTPAWVMANTTAVVSAGDVVSNTLNPTELQFGILSKSINPAAVGAPLSASLSEGDVAVVLLPLRHVLTALPHLFNGKDDNALPEVWRVFGCVPQLCLVTMLQPWQRTATLTTFTSPSISSSYSHSYSYSSTTTAGTISSSISGGPMSFTFSHALRALIESREHFYIKRLTTLGSSLGAVSAIHMMHRKAFANTLLEPHIASKMFRAYHRALERELLTGDRWSVVYQRLLLHRSLNEWQMRAIAAVLTAAAPGWEKSNMQINKLPQAPDVFIIEGPPGTGKTQTIAALLLNLLHFLPKHGRRLLVCAPSNCAVDEVLLRVRSQLSKVPQLGELQLLRVGVRESVDSEVLAASPPIFLDDCVSMLSDASSNSRSGPTGLVVRNGNRDDSSTSGGNSNSNNNNSSSGSGRQLLRDQLLRGAHVVCSTLGSLTQLQRVDMQFDMVIVDEASQGSEPDVLQALMLTKRRVVLVGDSKQLQPTVLCQSAAGRGLRRSLLQRLLHEGYRSYLLRTQYRMHPDICAFPNKYFYDGKLHTHESVLRRQYNSINSNSNSSNSNRISSSSCLRLPNNSAACCGSRFVFVDVRDGRMELGRGRSLVNRREAEAVVMQMRRFRALLQLTPHQFAQHACVITFYQAQRDAIVQLLTREERNSELMVATVDSFQGKERDVVFISCVRAPHIAQQQQQQEKKSQRVVSLGFMEDWHRINVALTRAKELCIVFGHQQTFRDAAISSAMKQQQQQQKDEENEEEEEEEEDEEEELQISGTTGNVNNSKNNNNDDDNDNDDDDDVCEVAPSSRKSDDDPFVLDRLVQHVECFSKKGMMEQQQQQQSISQLQLQESPDTCVSAAIFANSERLHLAKELFFRP